MEYETVGAAVDGSAVGQPKYKVKAKRKPLEVFMNALFFLCGMVAVAFVLIISIYLVISGLPAILEIGPINFLFGTRWYASTGDFGIFAIILTSIAGTAGAILIGVPIGLMTAIFLAKVANPKLAKVVHTAVELLAGIPSVVYGFFGLVVLVPLIQKTFGLPVGETALAGSLILAVMALPTIITVAEDAMRGTPRAMREASLALGATHWQTIYRVVIPYAGSGISAAVVLGIGRAIGETMAVLMVTGNAAVMPRSLFEPVRTIPATIAAELGEAPAGGAHYQSLFMLGCILFIITMVISVTAEMISKRQSNKGL